MDYLMYTGKHYVTLKVKAGPPGEIFTAMKYWGLYCVDCYRPYTSNASVPAKGRKSATVRIDERVVAFGDSLGGGA
jgi:hypothetical protein